LGPPIVESRSVEKEAVLEAAKLMLIAARTAPKSGGIDDILTSIVYGKEMDTIAKKSAAIKTAKNSRKLRKDLVKISLVQHVFSRL